MRFSLLILIAFVSMISVAQAQEETTISTNTEDIMVVPAATDANGDLVATAEVVSTAKKKKKRFWNKRKNKNTQQPNTAATFELVDAGDADRVKNMGKDSINFYQKNEAGQTALTLAIEKQDVQMVEALVNNAVINHKNAEGETPLTLAIKTGNRDIIKLVSKRAKAALKNGLGEHPLFLAMDLDDLYLLDDLIRKGADVNQKSKGVTPLSKAVMANKARTVAFLIKHGATINVANDNGETPLSIATRKGYSLVAAILINKSADPIGITNWKTRIGTPLIHIAAEQGTPEIIHLLVNNGADIETVDFMENTALSIAATTGKLENIRALMQKNADINHQNILGETPLMLASTNFQEEAASILLSSGADKNVRNYNGADINDFYSNTAKRQATNRTSQEYNK